MAFIAGLTKTLPTTRGKQVSQKVPTICSKAPQQTRTITRRTALATFASAAAGVLLSATANAAESAQSSLQYSVVKSGDGPSPELGDLVGIRFKGTYNGVVFDNLFEDKTPYFYRVGSGTILKGIEEAIMLMKVGDIYDLTLPGDLAFGTKGRRASAGKPSIPPNATVSYTLELSTIPGKESELLESLDDDEI